MQAFVHDHPPSFKLTNDDDISFQRINDLDEIVKVISRPEDLASDETVAIFMELNHTAQGHKNR